MTMKTADKNPYPVKYIEPIILKEGTIVQLRPIHPDDGNQAQEFQDKLSPESIHERFLGYAPKISERLVNYMTVIDYKRHMAMIAEVAIAGEKEIIGVGRIAKDGESTAEFSIIIADAWHGKGLGSIMTDYMISVAKDIGYKKIYSLVFSKNTRMLEILKNEGFHIQPQDELTSHAKLNL